MRNLAFVAILIIGLVALNSFLLPYFSQKELPQYSKVGDFSLSDQNGKIVGAEHLDGKTTVLQLFFTSCPHVCPLVTSKVKEVAGELKHYDKVQFLSVTIDPERDDIEALNKYAAKHKLDLGRWLLLTGERTEIDRLVGESLYLDAGAEKNMHSTRLVLIDGNRIVRGYYASDDQESLKRLIEDAGSLAE